MSASRHTTAPPRQPQFGGDLILLWKPFGLVGLFGGMWMAVRYYYTTAWQRSSVLPCNQLGVYHYFQRPRPSKWRGSISHFLSDLINTGWPCGLESSPTSHTHTHTSCSCVLYTLLSQHPVLTPLFILCSILQRMWTSGFTTIWLDILQHDNHKPYDPIWFSNHMIDMIQYVVIQLTQSCYNISSYKSI